MFPPMRLVTYRSDRGPRAGVLRDDAVVDAWDALGGDGSSVRELLEAGRLADAGRDRRRRRASPLEQVELLPPVPDPEKIVCIGLNYRAHAAEAGIEPPDAPDLLRQVPQRPGARRAPPCALPGGQRQGRLRGRGRVRGRAARQGRRRAEALDHVAGYMLLNDLSARDLQFATPQWMPGKVFDGSAPCGPALVTPDEAGPARRDLVLARPERRADAGRRSTDDLIFSVPAAGRPPLAR